VKEETPEANAKLLLHLSEEVKRIAGSLAQLSLGSAPPPRRDYPFSNSNELDVPLERVNWLIQARRTRARYLTPELFADPAWDILLDLLRAEIAHERISVSSACIAAAVPATTGLRWLRALEQRGLVERQRDLHDARRTFVVLSEDTSKALRRYFLEVVGPQPPDGP
jgi:DNA-binding MarR family transcriptional regulator